MRFAFGAPDAEEFDGVGDGTETGPEALSLEADKSDILMREVV
jgi:hypothetical protein